MFHTGSAKDLGKKEAIIQAKAGLKKVLEGYKGKALLLIEIAAGAGEVIGDSFEEIAELMKDIKKYPGFGGVCFDTQHAFASGYDLKDDKAVKATFERFDQVIGLEWLKMSHINDSKVELGARKDRHEHINEGKIGEKGFGALLKNWKLKIKNSSIMPLILETEHDKVKADIKLLKKIRDTK
jgi:deoxyribonuclease-4